MYEAGILLVAMLAYYFKNRNTPLVFNYQFVFGDVKQNIRGDWMERKYSCMEDYYEEEEEIIYLCTDPEKNRSFRDIGITGVVVIHEGAEIFYAHMKKEE